MIIKYFITIWTKNIKKKILMLGKIYVNPEKIVILRSVIKRDFTVV